MGKIEILGKRKKRGDLSFQDSGDHTSKNLPADYGSLNVFKQYFEDKFAPLEIKPSERSSPEAMSREQSEDSSDLSDWEGLSEDEAPVEMVEDSRLNRPTKQGDKAEFKSFMRSRIPKSNDDSVEDSRSVKSRLEKAQEADEESTHLKNDLALQRLLKESHLLKGETTLTPSGKSRHKAVDLRLQDMGSKSSIFHQKNMPMAQRKGISAKAKDRDQTRRLEAQENGIILEKATSDKAVSKPKRERGIGVPSVGKFRGGILKLSKRDVHEIQRDDKKKPRRKR